MGSYEFLPHTADEKFRIRADTLEDAFTTAVTAFYEVLLGKEQVQSLVTKKISLQAKTKRSLLYDFLNELVFLFDAEDLLLPYVDSLSISKNPQGYLLQAVMRGDTREKYDLVTEIKNMTYSEMQLKEFSSGESFQGVELVVVVDI